MSPPYFPGRSLDHKPAVGAEDRLGAKEPLNEDQNVSRSSHGHFPASELDEQNRCERVHQDSISCKPLAGPWADLRAAAASLSRVENRRNIRVPSGRARERREGNTQVA
jgi:hypothetical protein